VSIESPEAKIHLVLKEQIQEVMKYLEESIYPISKVEKGFLSSDPSKQGPLA